MRFRVLRPSAVVLIPFGILSLAGIARGQFAVVDTTRSISAQTDGTSPNNNLGAGASDSHSQSTTASGVFNQSVTAAINYLDTTQNNFNGGNPTYVGTDTSAQNSLVSTSLFSGSGSSSGNSQVKIPAEPTDGEYTTGDTNYKTDFTVSAPTVLSISGTLYADYYYGLGKLPTPAAAFTLSSSLSGTPIYTEQTSLPFSFFESVSTVPLSFEMTLEPGQTYTLLVDASTTSSFYSDTDGTEQNDSSFSFTAGVPEPASLSLPILGLLAMRRRRVGESSGV